MWNSEEAGDITINTCFNGFLDWSFENQSLAPDFDDSAELVL